MPFTAAELNAMLEELDRREKARSTSIYTAYLSMCVDYAMSPRREYRAPVSRVGRFPGTPKNAKCPCGSGHKYKKCCW